MPDSDGVVARKPGADSAAKARRRESSMLLMSSHLGDAGQRKSSMPMLRSNAGMSQSIEYEPFLEGKPDEVSLGLVDEESAFE